MDNVEYLQCPRSGCGHSPFPVSELFVERARRTHETFYCPAGHSQHFPGKSKEERLQAEVNMLAEELRQLREREREIARMCPWIDCTFVATVGSRWDRSALWNHMRHAHGMPTRAQREAEILELQNSS